MTTRKINFSIRTPEGTLLEALTNFEKRLESPSYSAWNESDQEFLMGIYHTIRPQLIPSEFRMFMAAWSEVNLEGNVAPLNSVVTEIFNRVQTA